MEPTKASWSRRSPGFEKTLASACPDSRSFEPKSCTLLVLVAPDEGAGEVAGVEWAQVFHALADADQLHGQP